MKKLLLFVFVLPFFVAAVPTEAVQPKKEYARGLVVPKDLAGRVALSWAKHSKRLKKLPKVTAEKWDARDLGMVSPVKQQGGCGSCWNFSGTGAIESSHLKTGAGKPDGTFGISEQYTMDCGQNGGCDGDWPETVAIHAKRYGLPTEQQYGPYRAGRYQCRSTAGMRMYTISDYGYVGSDSGVPSVQAIKDALVRFGPLAVAVAADDAWANYGGGVYAGNGTGINHAVMIVGWDDTVGGGVWIVRNSWGVEWGEKGYMRSKYGANQIGFGAMWVTAVPLPPLPPDPDPVPPVPPIPPDPVPPRPCRWPILNRLFPRLFPCVDEEFEYRKAI